MERLLTYFMCMISMFFVNNTIGQRNIIDSLISIQNVSKIDDNFILRDLAIAKKYKFNLPDSNFFYSNRALINATNIYNENLIVESQFSLGGYYLDISKKQLAKNLYIKIVNFYIKTNAKEKLLASYNNLGLCYRGFNTDSTIFYYEKSIEIAKFLHKEEFVNKINVNLASSYQTLGDFEKAMAINLSTLAYFETKKSEKEIASINGNIASIFFIQKDYNSAISYFRKAAETHLKTNNLFGLKKQYTSVLDCFRLMHDDKNYYNQLKVLENSNFDFTIPEKSRILFIRANKLWQEDKPNNAILLLKKALQLNDEDPFNLQGIYATLGAIYNELGQFKEAIPYIIKALKLSEQMENKAFIIQNTKELSIAQNGLGYKDSAYVTLLKSTEVRDSIYSSTRAIDVKELETKYQTEKKEAENKYLIAEKSLKEATISTQNKMLWGTSIGIFGITALSLLLYNQSRKRNQANILLEDQKSEIELLNKELNHRVKNNLAFMTSLLEMQGRRLSNVEAKEALKESESRLRALSLVHNNLVRNHESKEINLKNYLEELTQSLQDAFSISDLKIRTSFIDFNIDAEKAMRKGLILNELITNSVKHAFTDVAHPIIDITMTVEEGVLKLSYSDNGPDSEKQFFILQSNPTNSLGIKMINLLVQQLDGTIKQRAGGLSMDFSI